MSNNKTVDKFNRTWTLSADESSQSEANGDAKSIRNHDRLSLKESDNENSFDVVKNLPPKPNRHLNSSNSSSSSYATGAKSMSLFTLTSNDCDMFIHRFNLSLNQQGDNFESLFEETLSGIECKDDWWPSASHKQQQQHVNKSAKLNSTHDIKENKDVDEEMMDIDDGMTILNEYQQKTFIEPLPFNQVPNTFDMFANHLNDVTSKLINEKNASLSSSKKLHGKMSEHLTSSASISNPSNHHLTQFKSSMKILTSSVDKDLNKANAINILNNRQKSIENLIAKPIINSFTSSESLNDLKIALKSNNLNTTSTALNSKASSMYNLNDGDNNEVDMMIEADNDDNNNISERVVFDKTYTSWAINDQQLHLQTLNKLTAINKTVDIENNELNVTRDINDPDDEGEDEERKKINLNLTHEIISTASSSSSNLQSVHSSLNNLNVRSQVSHENQQQRQILNRTISISDSDEVRDEFEEENFQTNQQNETKLLAKKTVRRKSSVNKPQVIFDKPVIEPPPTLRPQPSTISSKTPSNTRLSTVKPAITTTASKLASQTKLIEPKKVTASKMAPPANKHVFAVPQSTAPASNDAVKSFIPKVKLGIASTTTNVASKLPTLKSPTKAKPNGIAGTVTVPAKAPLSASNNAQLKKPQINVNTNQQTSQNPQAPASVSATSLSPNSMRLSSSSSTSSSSSLKENKKQSISPSQLKSPVYTTSTSKLRPPSVVTTATAIPTTQNINHNNNNTEPSTSNSKLKQFGLNQNSTNIKAKLGGDKQTLTSSGNALINDAAGSHKMSNVNSASSSGSSVSMIPSFKGSRLVQALRPIPSHGTQTIVKVND